MKPQFWLVPFEELGPDHSYPNIHRTEVMFAHTAADAMNQVWERMDNVCTVHQATPACRITEEKE